MLTRYIMDRGGRPVLGLALFVLLGLKACGEPAVEEWPQFRGPDGQGHSSATGLPLTWSEKEHIVWKKEVPGLGWSSPVLRGEQVWLTTATKEGRSLHLLCLDQATGRTLRDIEVFSPEKPGTLHSKNSYASPTPILEGNRIYIHFGQLGTACLTTDGTVVWKKILPYTPGYGPSSSPVLFEDLLIVPCHGTDVRYVVALEKATGKELWKMSRDGRHSEATPLVIRAGKEDQLICNFADHVVAYDPRTGKELWKLAEPNFAHVPRPVYGHGLVFVCGGYFKPVLNAIRPDRAGEVVWSHRKNVSLNPSPLLVGNEIYMVSDKGIATCLDARTGKVHWEERLGGDFSASPLSADGRIYFLNEEGVTTVVAPDVRFRKLATNRLDGRTLASPSVFGKAIYLRTDHHLYRIEGNK